MQRAVTPELLDDLPPADPLATGSRADLRRLNGIMGHAGILSRAFRENLHTEAGSRLLRICELGAGDGTLLLKIARRFSSAGVTAQVIFVDQQNLVSKKTRRDFQALHWAMENAEADVFDWLEQSAPRADVIFANLFLHHFREDALRKLLRMVSKKTDLFIACEPRRAALALTASRLLGLIGCNSVTRHDAVVSVRAGFSGGELSTHWPADDGWQLNERRSGLFSHCFVAKRHG